jgi:hypothetical protein
MNIGIISSIRQVFCFRSAYLGEVFDDLRIYLTWVALKTLRRVELSLTGALTRRNNHSGYYFGGEVQLSEKVGEDHFIHAQCAFGSFIEGGGVHDGKCVVAMLVVPRNTNIGISIFAIIIQ